MYFYQMTILEETESEYQSKLMLWDTIQVGSTSDDLCETQGIAITPEDGRALINELTRLLQRIEGEQPGSQQKQIKINFQ
jgi:hypothetical protein